MFKKKVIIPIIIIIAIIVLAIAVTVGTSDNNGTVEECSLIAKEGQYASIKGTAKSRKQIHERKLRQSKSHLAKRAKRSHQGPCSRSG